MEAPIDGVLVITERLDQGTARQAFLVQALPAGPAAPWGPPGDPGARLAGGLVLNAMPCVLPVLSVKALALVRHAGAGRAVTAAHGLAYTLGVLVSFAVLAGVLLALRAGGERIGWGFQLQAPWFVTLLAYVFFAMALALSGVLPISGRLTVWARAWPRAAATPAPSSPARWRRSRPRRAPRPSWARRWGSR